MILEGKSQQKNAGWLANYSFNKIKKAVFKPPSSNAKLFAKILKTKVDSAAVAGIFKV